MPVVHAITSEWSLELEDDDYERRAQEGDVVLWKPRRTVYAAVFRMSDAQAEEAIAKMLEGRPGVPKQAFDREEPGLAGHAYLLPESAGARDYWGLNTWTAAKGAVACVTFYFDDADDLPWALAAWRSVRPAGGQEKVYAN